MTLRVLMISFITIFSVSGFTQPAPKVGTAQTSKTLISDFIGCMNNGTDQMADRYRCELLQIQSMDYLEIRNACVGSAVNVEKSRATDPVVIASTISQLDVISTKFFELRVNKHLKDCEKTETFTMNADGSFKFVRPKTDVKKLAPAPSAGGPIPSNIPVPSPAPRDGVQ